MKKSQHGDVFLRSLIVLIAFMGFFIVVMYKISTIAIYEEEKWLEMKDRLYVEYKSVEAERGNIISQNGSLLATSIQFFDIRMDFQATGLTDEAFMKGVDSLALMLSEHVNPSKSVQEYKNFLLRKRKEKRGNRYVLLKRNATFEELSAIKKFPILRRGQNSGGLIIERKSKRAKPFGTLASRTIGISRKNAEKVGLELTFDEVLAGEEGKRLMQNVGSGDWLPVKNVSDIEPKRGHDIRTTLNVNIQDITENALEKQLVKHKAKYGVAAVMEVKTGKIRALANLSRLKDGSYEETYNYAVGAATAPGSTFKTAFMLALMEQGYYDSEEMVNIDNGYIRVCNEDVHDAELHNYSQVNINRAFEISSNVGMIRLAQKYFSSKQREFIEQLREFRLHMKTGIEIVGEAEPYIKNYRKKEENQWSCTTVPWMSMGYELSLTPLQLLTFYNAIANDGKMMQPYLVEAIEKDGKVTKQLYPEVLNDHIASEENIEKIQGLLEAVVKRGTASRLRTDRYDFAGKTGTSNLALGNADRKKYQASFVGYFPANKPKYSIIVVAFDPKVNGYYGSTVAGPVFREIADKCYASLMDVNIASIDNDSIVYKPRIKGNIDDVKTIYAGLNIEIDEHKDVEWVEVESMNRDTTIVQSVNVDDGTVPDVRGMALKDAIFLLENMNLRVHFDGEGEVKRQSIAPGTENLGQKIKLILG